MGKMSVVRGVTWQKLSVINHQSVPSFLLPFDSHLPILPPGCIICLLIFRVGLMLQN